MIDVTSKRPIAGAIVALGGPPAPNGQPRQPVLTGPDGRFVFRDWPRGYYNLNAVKPGYVDGAYGHTRAGGPSAPQVIKDDDRRGDIVLRLWPHAAVSGVVVDESGERQVGVHVRAYRRTSAGGRRRFLPAGVASTDDRGIYRIGTLTPGHYIVGTAPRPFRYHCRWRALAETKARSEPESTSISITSRWRRSAAMSRCRMERA